MTRSTHRESDAAFFEDWSEWRHLDSKPPRPRGRDSYGIPILPRASRHLYSRYYCILSLHCGVLDGAPGFEIAVPGQHPIKEIVRGLPGAQQHRLATASARNVAYSGLQNTYWIPATHWRAVRAKLPEIKRLVTAYAERYAATHQLSYQVGGFDPRHESDGEKTT